MQNGNNKGNNNNNNNNNNNINDVKNNQKNYRFKSLQKNYYCLRAFMANADIFKKVLLIPNCK